MCAGPIPTHPETILSSQCYRNTKKTKSVTFEETIRVRIYQQHDEDKENKWLDKEAFKKFKRDCGETVNWFVINEEEYARDMAALPPSLSTTYCSRGIEKYMPKEARTRTARKSAIRKIVFKCQLMPAITTDDLAAKCQFISIMSETDAYCKAIRYEQEEIMSSNKDDVASLCSRFTEVPLDGNSIDLVTPSPSELSMTKVTPACAAWSCLNREDQLFDPKDAKLPSLQIAVRTLWRKRR